MINHREFRFYSALVGALLLREVVGWAADGAEAAAGPDSFHEAMGREGSIAARVGGKAVTLDNALRVTLWRQPSIRLSQADLEVAEAALLEAAAPFDLTVIAGAEHGRRYRPRYPSDVNADLIRRLAAVSEESLNVVEAGVNARIAESLATQAAVLDLMNGSFPALAEPALAAQVNAEEVLRARLARLTELRRRSIGEGVAVTERIGESGYSIGLSKFARSGVIVAPRMDWERAGSLNAGTINLDFIVPLAQGRGAITERAVEDAARVDLEASKWQLRHEIATALLQTASAFWRLVAAQREYQLLTDAEALAGTFAALTELRVEKGEMSRGEAAIAAARQAEAAGQRIEAGFAVFRARQQLGLAMGLVGEELIEPPLAAGALPTGGEVEGLRSLDYTAALRKVLWTRDDQLAALQLVDSGKILAAAAKFDQKPVVDLFVNLAMTGANEGTRWEDTFAAFGTDTTGLEAFGGVSMQWPLRLSAARGAVEATDALYGQRQTAALDLERQIASGMRTAIAQCLATREQIAAADKAARLSGEALESGRVRYEAGESTLLDSVQLEQAYTFRLRNLIFAELNHAVALSSLRYETGTLLDPALPREPESVSFCTENLWHLPDWDSMSAGPVSQASAGSRDVAEKLVLPGNLLSLRRSIARKR